MKNLLFIIFLFVCNIAHAFTETTLQDQHGNYVGTSSNPLHITGTLISSYTDPIVDYGASGSIVTTTGTIASGTNSLSVASTTGWSVGMGISVANAGTGGNTQLISSVTAINGTTFTLANNASATATSQTVNHDDTVALQNAVNSGKCVSLRVASNYRITSQITFNSGSCLTGTGTNNSIVSGLTNIGSMIWWGSPSGNAFYVPGNYVSLRNFSMQQDTTVTPTSGYSIVIGNNTTTKTRGVVVDNFWMSGMHGGIKIQNSITQGYLNNIFLNYYGGNSDSDYDMYYHNDSPAGAEFINNVWMGSANVQTIAGTCLYIDSADTTTFNNIELTCATTGLTISAASGKSVAHVKFTNLLVEDASTGGLAAIRIANAGSYTQDITFTNLHMGVNSSYGVRVSGTVSDLIFDSGLVDASPGANAFDFESSVSHIYVGGIGFESVGTAFFIGTGTSDIHIGKNTYDNVTTIISNTTNVPIDYDINGSANFTGNVGIGTLVPSNALAVVGAASIGSVGNVGIAAPANGLYVQGNVGLGTVASTSILQVSGTCANGTGPIGSCWTATGQLGYCSGAAGVCSTCTPC